MVDVIFTRPFYHNIYGHFSEREVHALPDDAGQLPSSTIRTKTSTFDEEGEPLVEPKRNVRDVTPREMATLRKEKTEAKARARREREEELNDINEIDTEAKADKQQKSKARSRARKKAA